MVENGKIGYIVDIGDVRMPDEKSAEVEYIFYKRGEWDSTKFKVVISDDAGDGNLNFSTIPVEKQSNLLIIPGLGNA